MRGAISDAAVEGQQLTAQLKGLLWWSRLSEINLFAVDVHPCLG